MALHVLDEANRCLGCKKPMCQQGCPIRTNIPEVVRLLKEYPSLEELYRKLLFISSSRHRDLKMAAYQYTAIQRYQWFLTEYPGLIDKISHKYIASLLNMTPVTLSKIRKDLKKGKTDAALAVFSAESSGEACPPKTR